MIEKGLRRSERIMPILSPAYLDASPFATAEWQAAWQSDPNGFARRLVPVRVKPCDPAGLLGAIVYIDLVGLDMAAARTTLAGDICAALRGRRCRRRAPFPGGDPPLA
jgi:hypothetical protein